MEHAQDIINECWRSINGNINYQVSNTHQVRNSSTGKILSDQRVNSKGYKIVGLYKDGVGKNYLVHRLVAEHFIPKPESDEKLQVDHINRDKTDNNISNLMWKTSQQNNWNKDKINKPTSSKYIGVSFKTQCQKWQALIRQNHGHNTHIGLFQHEKDAARAYNAKAYELRGNFAVLNDISDDED